MKTQTNRGFSIFEALLVMATLAGLIAIVALYDHRPDTSLEEVGRQQYLTNITANEVMQKWNTALAMKAVDPADHPNVESKVRVLIAHNNLGLDETVLKNIRNGRVGIGDVSEMLEVTGSGRLRWRSHR